MTSSSNNASTVRWIAVASFLAGCSVATLVLRWRTTTSSSSRSSSRKKKNSQEINPLNGTTQSQHHQHLPDTIREEQISRHALFFGKDKMAVLKQTKICIVGVGGVGSHCAHLLARSGIGFLRIIDFDQVTVSSLNRHACARLCDVGQSKVQVLKDFCTSICPDERFLQIDVINEMYTEETGDRLLELPDDNNWTMVLDCIDDVPTKTALIMNCLQKQIPIISCMGAGGKSDPTRLHLSDLRSAVKDPLATKLRQSLKKKFVDQNNNTSSYLDDMKQLTVLYSSEKTVVKLADFTPDQKAQGVHSFGAVDGMRIRVVPVLGTMPSIMGLAMASYCLTQVASNVPFQPVPCERIGRNARHKIYQHLRNREIVWMKSMEQKYMYAEKEDEMSVVETTSAVYGTGKLYSFVNPEQQQDDETQQDELDTASTNNGESLKQQQQQQIWVGDLQIDPQEDVEYLMEIWRNRCAVTGARLGTVLHLIRWDYSKPSRCDNLVLVSSKVLQEYEANPTAYKAAMDTKLLQSIEQRLDSCRI